MFIVTDNSVEINNTNTFKWVLIVLTLTLLYTLEYK